MKIRIIDRIRYRINTERIEHNLRMTSRYGCDREIADEYYSKAREIVKRTIPIAQRLGKSTQEKQALEIILKA